MKGEPPVRLQNSITRRLWSQGLTDEALAVRSGLSRRQIQRIRNRKAIPRVGAALAIANALGCHVSDVFHLIRLPD